MPHTLEEWSEATMGLARVVDTDKELPALWQVAVVRGPHRKDPR